MTKPPPQRSAWREIIRSFAGWFTAAILVSIIIRTYLVVNSAANANANALQLIEIYMAPIFYGVCITGICVAVYVATRAKD